MDDCSELEECFDWIRQGGWTWFVTLKYPAKGSPKHPGSRAGSAEDAFRKWANEMFLNVGRSSVDGYVRATEQRANADTLFHILLRSVPWDWQKHLRWRWFEIAAGAAWDRPLDEGVERLFKYFFYKVHCDIECYVAGDTKVYRADEYAPRK